MPETPHFIKENHYILHGGKKRLVQDFYHAAEEKLMVLLEGVDDAQAFNPDTMERLEPKNAPDWLKKGAKIIYYRGFGKVPLETTVLDVFGVQKKGERLQTHVALESFLPDKFDGRSMKPALERK